MRLPVRIRLALASCSIFIALVAGIEVIAYATVRTAIESVVDHELETRLAGLDDHLARHFNRVPWPELRDSLKAHPAFQPDMLRISTGSGAVLFEGDGLHSVEVARSAAPSIATVNGDRTLRVYHVKRTIGGNDFDLALATDLSFSAKILGRLWKLMWLSLPAVLLIAGSAGYWLSGRAMRPVSNIIAAVRAIDSTRLSERIEVPRTGDEIQQLAETMNGMLSGIDAGFHQVRQFIANASHELRTPVAIIRANAEIALLEKDRSGRAYREALARILKEAERDSVLIDDMLRLARADAGVLLDESRRQAVDLNMSLAQACSDLRPLAEARDLALRVSPFPAPCLVHADEDQLRRLWFILLDNACKYTHSGGTISAGVLLGEDGCPSVYVLDTGIGIAPEHRERIFERFYRVDKARSRREGGTGLGLAIAHQIAAAHEAKVHLESEPGKGSRFSVTFASLHPSAARAASGAGAIFR